MALCLTHGGTVGNERLAVWLSESYHGVMILMLLLMAAEPATQGTQASGTATVRIVNGARISMESQRVANAQAEPQRRLVVRKEAGRTQPIRLIEFQ